MTPRAPHICVLPFLHTCTWASLPLLSPAVRGPMPAAPQGGQEVRPSLPLQLRCVSVCVSVRAHVHLCVCVCAHTRRRVSVCLCASTHASILLQQWFVLVSEFACGYARARTSPALVFTLLHILHDPPPYPPSTPPLQPSRQRSLYCRRRCLQIPVPSLQSPRIPRDWNWGRAAR